MTLTFRFILKVVKKESDKSKFEENIFEIFENLFLQISAILT